MGDRGADPSGQGGSGTLVAGDARFRHQSDADSPARSASGLVDVSSVVTAKTQFERRALVVSESFPVERSGDARSQVREREADTTVIGGLAGAERSPERGRELNHVLVAGARIDRTLGQLVADSPDSDADPATTWLLDAQAHEPEQFPMPPDALDQLGNNWVEDRIDQIAVPATHSGERARETLEDRLSERRAASDDAPDDLSVDSQIGCPVRVVDSMADIVDGLDRLVDGSLDEAESAVSIHGTGDWDPDRSLSQYRHGGSPGTSERNATVAVAAPNARIWWGEEDALAERIEDGATPPDTVLLNGAPAPHMPDSGRAASIGQPTEFDGGAFVERLSEGEGESSGRTA